MKRLIVLAAVLAGVLLASLPSDASAGWRRGYYGPGWRRGYSYSYGYPGYYRYPAYGYYGRPSVVVQTPGFVYRSGPAYYGGYYYGSPYSGGYYW